MTSWTFFDALYPYFLFSEEHEKIVLLSLYVH